MKQTCTNRIYILCAMRIKISYLFKLVYASNVAYNRKQGRI